MRAKWKFFGVILAEVLQPIMVALATPVRTWLTTIGNGQMAAWAFVALFGPLTYFMCLEYIVAEDPYRLALAANKRADTARIEAETAKIEEGLTKPVVRFNNVGSTPQSEQLVLSFLTAGEATQLVVFLQDRQTRVMRTYLLLKDQAGRVRPRQDIEIPSSDFPSWLKGQQLHVATIQMTDAGVQHQGPRLAFKVPD